MNEWQGLDQDEKFTVSDEICMHEALYVQTHQSKPGTSVHDNYQS